MSNRNALLLVGGIGFLLLTFKYKEAIPYPLLKLVHSTLSVCIRILRLHKKKEWQPKLNVSKHQKSDVKAGYPSPSPEHFALDLMLRLAKKKNASLSDWRELTKSPLLAFVHDPTCEISPRIVKDGKIKVKVLDVSSGTNVRNPQETVIVYIHGGGYCAGSAMSYVGFASKLSKFTATRIVAVDYDVCPEGSLQNQIMQGCAVVQDLKEKGHEIILGGDSAGAGLCVGIIQHFVNSGKKDLIPKASFLIAPYVDVAGLGESYQKNFQTDSVITPEIMQICRDCATPDDLLPVDPRVSFVNGSFKNFPPLYITVSETEMLYSDAVSVCEKVRANGGQVVFEAMPYGLHDFILFGDLVPEYEESFKRVCDFIKNNLSS